MPALGRTICCKNQAYHPETSLFSAPLMNPCMEAPGELVNTQDVSFCPKEPKLIETPKTFPKPAVNHSYPAYSRRINQNQAVRVSAKMNRATGGSGICAASCVSSALMLCMVPPLSYAAEWGCTIYASRAKALDTHEAAQI